MAASRRGERIERERTPLSFKTIAEARSKKHPGEATRIVFAELSVKIIRQAPFSETLARDDERRAQRMRHTSNDPAGNAAAVERNWLRSVH
jgi:hypothetical protein